MDEEGIFAAALNINSAEQREEFLRQACGEDSALRQRLDELIQSHQEAGSFLDEPALPAPTIDQPVAEKSGDQIGHFRLLQQIGEGGMGVVFMAEQKHPVQRRVALKVVKPGMDSKQVIARFETERQALALMDHPNIARAIDVGTTESGRPYFVMELVKGTPITQYCDEHRLTPHERLKLFKPLCHAIEHAHQKGIIHRDLKPSNTLVAEYDHQAIPKIIDFGIAKALNQQLTEKTLFTQFGQIVGTPEYMSPEQAKVNQLDVDTRSDIYSLGVLLYELLTGSTPFDKELLHGAAWDELARIIREEEPPKPSMKVSTSKMLPSIAALRQTDPEKLTRLVRGELDWIVMMAINKDRDKRYGTATELAADIQRYLDDEPIRACPPSTSYRFRKFFASNRPAIITTLTIGIILVVAAVSMAVSGWKAMRAEARTAKQLQATDEAKLLAESNLERALDAIKLMLTRLASERLKHVPQMTGVRSELLEDAEKVITELAAENPGNRVVAYYVADVSARAADIHAQMGEYEKAEQKFARAIEQWQRLAENASEPRRLLSDSSRARRLLGQLFQNTNRYQESIDAYRLALADLDEAEANDTPLEIRKLRGKLYVDMGSVFNVVGRFEDSEREYRAALEVFEQLADAPRATDVRQGLIACHQALGRICLQRGEIEQATSFLQKAAALARALVAEEPGNPNRRDYLSAALNGLFIRALMQDQLDEAGEAVIQAIENQQQTVQDFPEVVSYRQNLALLYSNYYLVLSRQDDYEACVAVGQKLVAERRRVVREITEQAHSRQDSHASEIGSGLYLASGVVRSTDALAWALSNLADSLVYVGNVEAAETAYAESRELAPQMPAPPNNLASAYLNVADPALRKPTRALELAEEATRLDPDAAGFWQTLGLAQYRLGQAQQALSSLETALEKGWDDADLHFVWALVLQALERPEAARAELSRGLEKLDDPETDSGLRREAEMLIPAEDSG